MSDLEAEERKTEMIFQYMLIESKNVAEQDGPYQPIKAYHSAVRGVEEFLILEKKRIENALSGNE